MKIVAVLNPASGGGVAMKAWTMIKGSFDTSQVRLVETVCAGQATEIAHKAAIDGADRIVAIGGDGTVNEVMNGLVGSDAALAVVPAGTGNDWVRTVGIPRMPYDAWGVAIDGRIMKCDVGIAVGHRHFLNIAGVGFDSEVARVMRDDKGLAAKYVPPTERYIINALKTLIKYKGGRVRLDIDGKTHEVERMFLLAVANAKYYGSGMKIAPDASIIDGKFDLVWGDSVRRFEAFGLIVKSFRGKHVGHAKVHTAKCKKVTVESEVPMWFHLDGDVVGELPVTFRVLPKSLNVVLPKH